MDKTKNYYNVDKTTNKINAGPYTGLTLEEAKELNKHQRAEYDKKLKNKEASEFGNKVREGMEEGAKNIFPAMGAVIATPFLVGSTAASPLLALKGLIGGTMGHNIVDNVVKHNSNYTGWGDMVSKNTNLPIWASEFTNPGAIAGGVIGSKLKIPKKIGSFEILPKPNPNAHYRNIGGKEGYLDILTRGEVAPPKVAPPKVDIKPEVNSGIDLKNLKIRQYNRSFYAHKGEFSPALRYKGPYAVEANIPMRNGFGGNWGFAPDPNVTGFVNVPINMNEVRLLKQYRLPKSEKVLLQKELPKSETSIGFIEKLINSKK